MEKSAKNSLCCLENLDVENLLVGKIGEGMEDAHVKYIEISPIRNFEGSFNMEGGSTKDYERVTLRKRRWRTQRMIF